MRLSLRSAGFILCALAAACGGAAPEHENENLTTAAQPAGVVAASTPTSESTAQPSAERAATPQVQAAAGRSSAAPTTVASAGTSAAATATPPAVSAAPLAAQPAAGAAGSATGAAGADAMQAPPSVEPMGPLFPANGAQNVCADATLHLQFDAKPSLGSGKISVFEQGGSTPVASVDVSTARASVSPNGTALTFVQPVFVVDREVIVQLPAALDYGKTYYVKVDSGAVRGTGGAMPSTESDWTFSTRAAAPTDLTKLRVGLDGTGDFCSVQGALSAAASGATVTVGVGYYHELVHVSGKMGVTLRGDDRKKTVILGVNNDSLNGGSAKRALVNIEKSSDLIVERLTIHNLTEQGGSQAEALRLASCDKCVVRDADILSLQDTLLWDGRIYAKDLYVAGNVDFIWGKGAVFFDHCEIKTVGRKGYIVQSRNTPDGNGYVFVDSKITADAGITGIVLARIDAGEYPGSHVAFINCEMGRHIAPEGWTVTGASGSALRFWEYQSTDAAGGMLNVSGRHPSSRQITADQAATMRDPAMVLGGWQPPQ